MHYREWHAFRVRLTRDQPGGEEVEFIHWFSHLFFGCTYSPYAAAQGYTRVQEIVKGDMRDLSSLYHLDKVVLNMPTARGYNSSFPRVMKV